MHIQVTEELAEIGNPLISGDALVLMSGPDHKKMSEEGRSAEHKVAWASSSMRGWRERNEDATLMLPYGYVAGSWRDAALFGVFDGHGGEQVARFTVRRLPEKLAALSPQDPERALEAAYRQVDELLRDPSSASELFDLTLPDSEPRDSADRCGCTAVCCLIRGSQLYVANAGDSRAVLSREGKAVALSEDHKPALESESMRIEAAGGFVEEMAIPGGGKEHRVMGDLNLSRALGDLKYKDHARPPQKHIVSGVPDTQMLTWTAGKEDFVIMACDGVWECMSSQEVVSFVLRRLPPAGTAKGLTPILEALLEECCAQNPTQRGGLGCDNISAVLVRFESDTGAGAGASVAGPGVFETRVLDRRTEAAIDNALKRLREGRGKLQRAPTSEEAEQQRRDMAAAAEAEAKTEAARVERMKRRSARELQEQGMSAKKKAKCCALADSDGESDGGDAW